MQLYGAVEIGGTKTVVAVGSTFADMSDPVRMTTSDPDSTLGDVIDFFSDYDLQSVGVASFGPLNLDRSSSGYGEMMSTPKPGWGGAPLLQRLQDELGIPVHLDTDVNGAAVGEGRWGAAQGLSNYSYVTVGTGIGAGIVVGGKAVGGKRHPEMGHIVVSRLDGDRHEGSCPFHGDCLEGMAAGPALEARFGRPDIWPGNEQILRLAVHYLSQGMLNLVYIAGPERIIVGGGVSRLPRLHESLRERLGALIAKYPEIPDLDLLISRPQLDERSGLAGAFLLANPEAG